jgi:hypothetical protein
MIFCDIRIRPFVVQNLKVQPKIYHLGLLRYYILLSPFIRYFTPNVNLYIQSRMGQQNLIAFSIYNVDKVFIINEPFDTELIECNYMKYSMNFFRMELSKFFLREDIRLYKWENVIEAGIAKGDIIENVELYNFAAYKIQHRFDCILLDFPVEGLNLRDSINLIKNEFSKFKNVAVKKHPMSELGIGSYLPYEVIAEPIPVELYDSEKVVFYFLTSAAQSKIKDMISIFDFLVFNDSSYADIVAQIIKREKGLYGD